MLVLDFYSCYEENIFKLNETVYATHDNVNLQKTSQYPENWKGKNQNALLIVFFHKSQFRIINVFLSVFLCNHVA